MKPPLPSPSPPGRLRLPYGRQRIEDDDVAAVVAALRGDYLTTGPTIERFETAFAAAVGGVRNVVVCANGTAALHMACLGIGLGPDAAAIVPAVTFLATANAVRLTGAEVVFADVDPDTGLCEAEHVEAALRRADRPIKAVLPVALNGQAADMAALAAIARPRGMRIIEDACHALGSTYAGVPVGSCAHSDVAIFSFHPVKTITMGEGGALTTNDDELASILRKLRSHGMTRDPDEFVVDDQAFAPDGRPNPWYYEASTVGLNYRATDLQCALGLSQLAKLPRFSAERRRIAARYDQVLAPLANRIRPVRRAPLNDATLHLYVVHIDFSAVPGGRAAVIQQLADRGIGTQVHYLPVNRQPYYRQRYGAAALPGADAYYERALTLPLFVGMTDDDVDSVVAELAAALDQ